MRCSLLSSLRTSLLLLCLALLLQCGEARVLTEIQAGPLYRVVGYPLFISCNVSGFKSESSDKDFEFRIAKPSRPTYEMNIISTKDPVFSYAVYGVRVSSQEISLKRVSPNSVVFEIQRLEKGDEGEYDCTVVNSEVAYDGTYSTKTTVKVIDNSLSVSSPSTTSLSFYEGKPLTLTCQASSNTIQHTHLSFIWFLRKDGEENAQPIISLDRDFTLRPGQGFKERYQAGLISLDKLGDATYRLKMAQLQLSDRGKIFCQAQEWIQDPDRSWYVIAQKDAKEITLQVNAREVAPDTSSMVVQILAQPSSLQEGHELSLSCKINSENLDKRFFSVAWLRGSVELARIDPTGILIVGPDYSDRERVGELRASRISKTEYRLILQPVRMEEQGNYICRAWAQDRGNDGVFTEGATQDSTSELVSITATESGLSIQMSDTASVTQGDTLMLACKVAEVSGQLSVTWQHKSTPSAPFTHVIQLNQEGVVEIGEEFKNRKIRASRHAANNFVFELDEVTLSDAGVYQCAVSEWKTNSKTFSQSQKATVSVKPIDSELTVALIIRNSRVTVGENVELICRVRGPSVPVTLTWSLLRDATTLDNILTVYHDGSISWSGDQNHYQVKVENKKNQVLHYLQIVGASHREAGIYQCRASVFLENVDKKLPPSNTLGVVVQNPESKLHLSSNHTFTGSINTDIVLNCSVVSGSSQSSLYAVTWKLQQGGENKTILSSDQNCVVTFGPQADLKDNQRISMTCTKGPKFELTIRQARTSDTGSYICEVEEWLQDPRGDWYQLSTESSTTTLAVTAPEINLSIEQNDVEMNVSSSQDFEIPCNIVRQSSKESTFQVTWFWQNENGTDKRPIFTAYRNSTLQDKFGRGVYLRYDHPVPSQFSLTVHKTSPEDSGLYFCEVEEWLPSLAQSFSVKKSGIVRVNVNTEGAAYAASQCNSGTWIGITGVVFIISLVVIVLLVLRMCRDRKIKEKKGQSLWAEQPLKTNAAD